MCRTRGKCSMSKQKLVVIAGPTASGKSKLALDVASVLNGVVINADSMQVYKNTPILSACPSLEDKKAAPHRLYQIWDASVNGSVINWLNLAIAEIKLAWNENKLPVVVGGTGFYIDNLLNGSTPIPETSKETKDKVKNLISLYGINYLHSELKKIDPEIAQKFSENDVTRVRRAWEVFLDTGKVLSEWFHIPLIKKLNNIDTFVIKIIPQKQELEQRCFLRFDQMIEKGALLEVQNLMKLNLEPTLPAMKILGVPELMAYLRNEISLEEAVSLGKLHTRQYAKRQKTWFNNKLSADFVLDCCYSNQSFLIDNVIKFVKS